MKPLEIPVKIITIESSERRIFAALIFQTMLSDGHFSLDSDIKRKAARSLYMADIMIEEFNKSTSEVNSDFDHMEKGNPK